VPDIEAEASATIPAPPHVVYRILADYQEGHRSILPPGYFRDLRVEEGGIGAGTRISFEMRVLGSVRRFRAEVSEPEPGRRLVETDRDSGIATSFLVEPIGGQESSEVTIATRYRKDGVAGWVERWLAPRLLRRIYAEELALLADRAGPSQ
jgi:uncharacterized protein YndB with AHSA1/START domain